MPAVCCSSHGVPKGRGLKLWIDAQLPPALTSWIATRFGVEASNLDAVGLRHAHDARIFAALGEPGNVIVSKDEDFVDMVARLGPPPQVLWITCGNVTNRVLHTLLAAGLPNGLDLLNRGEPIVEIGGG